jgi:hypothetical protein
MLAQSSGGTAYGQTGILGFAVDNAPALAGTIVVALKGVYVNGRVTLRCEQNIWLWIPDTTNKVVSDLTCDDAYGNKITLSKWDFLPGSNLSAAVFTDVNTSDLYGTLSSEAVQPEVDWNGIRMYLESILSEELLAKRIDN